MNAKTNTQRFNSHQEKIKTKTRIRKNYTHHELVEKIERYKQFITSKKDFKEIEKVKEKYLKREGTKHIVRAKRDQVFLLGHRTGISPNKTLTDVYEGDKIHDKIYRQNIVQKAKYLYQKNYNIVEKFRHSAKEKTKMKSPEKLK